MVFVRKLKGVIRDLIFPYYIPKYYRLGLEHHKNIVGDKVFHHYQGKIEFGPFKDVLLDVSPWSSKGDLASKILGLYELQILELISTYPKFRRILNLGAADGYYALGFLASNRADFADCFEVDKRSQAQIATSAVANGVFNRIRIFGEATQSTLDEHLRINSDIQLVICDIEGAEYDIISDSILNRGRHIDWVIELHEFNPEQIILAESFILQCSLYFDVSFLTTAKKKIPRDPFLNSLTDDERSIIFSEGRPYSMRWLILRPKNLTNKY